MGSLQNPAMLIVRSLITVVACLALAGPALADSSPAWLDSPPALVSGPGPFAGCADSDPSASGGKPYVNDVVEPRIALDPRTAGTDHVHLVGVWQQDRWTGGGGATGIVSAISSDGGAHWDERPLPITSCASPDSKNPRASDPWVSIGPDGTVYASALTFPGPDLTVGVSRDGGQTWQDWQTITNGSGTAAGLPITADKESITADPTTPRVAYLVWDSNDTSVDGFMPMSVYFSVTRDGGQSWTPARQITPVSAGVSLSPELLVDPSSHALDVVVRFDRFIPPYGHICLGMPRSCTRRRIVPASDFASIAILSSHDGGSTWSSPRTIAPVCPVTGSAIPALVRDPDVPDATIDASGRLFVVWEDACFSSHTTRDIALSMSTDGGTTWSAPSEVNPPGGWHILPTIASSTGGTIGVMWAQFNPGTGTDRLLAGAVHGPRESLFPADPSRRSLQPGQRTRIGRALCGRLPGAGGGDGVLPLLCRGEGRSRGSHRCLLLLGHARPLKAFVVPRTSRVENPRLQSEPNGVV